MSKLKYDFTKVLKERWLHHIELRTPNLLLGLANMMDKNKKLGETSFNTDTIIESAGVTRKTAIIFMRNLTSLGYLKQTNVGKGSGVHMSWELQMNNSSPKILELQDIVNKVVQKYTLKRRGKK